MTRFWAKVQKKEECWEWQGAKHPFGYGLFYLRYEHGKSICVQAHRFLYEREHGPIPDGLCALHKCDNPQCVRPDHLFLGTRAENMIDKARKGRNKAPRADANRRKTQCINGHDFTPENTYRWRTERGCRICRRKHKATMEAKKKAHLAGLST